MDGAGAGGVAGCHSSRTSTFPSRLPSSLVPLRVGSETQGSFTVFFFSPLPRVSIMHRVVKFWPFKVGSGGWEVGGGADTGSGGGGCLKAYLWRPRRRA